MNELLLLKEGELTLKGLNRKNFEDFLINNLKRKLKPYGDFSFSAAQSIVYVEPKSGGCDMDTAFELACKTFGAVGVSRARACAKDKDAITECAKSFLRNELLAASSFKVESKRADKRFPMTSIELSQYVGGELAEAFPNVKVDVHNPELTVNAEVRDDFAYVHYTLAPTVSGRATLNGGSSKGAGGLPVGSSGRAVAMLSGG
ncbi:MAG: THUMP domain-containing protein, partial [Oscillospiraceae bacterium]|nr:THUMP domain-containing protein [Oscillospiraceae bacterium]